MRFPLALSLAFLVLASGPAAAVDAGRVAAAKRALEGANYLKTPERLVQVRAEFEALSAAEPKSALLHYWVAVADWRLAPRLMDKKEQAAKVVKDGLRHADEAIRLAPRMAEPLALKSSLLGLSIQIDPSTMMSVGPETEIDLQRALTLEPKNPRVWLLDGMGTLHKPAFVGGGPDKALAKLKKAEELFASEANSGGAAPDWGRFEVYAWAGRSAAQLGDVEEARGYYEKALAIQPDNGWVRNVLLPDLDRSRTSGVSDSSSGAKDDAQAAPAADSSATRKGDS